MKKNKTIKERLIFWSKLCFDQNQTEGNRKGARVGNKALINP